MADHTDVLKECEALESELAGLKAAWEQYFLGLDKRPPTERAARVKKRVEQLKGLFVRSTAVKFRVQGIAQKHSTLDRLWARTLTEMENGTYHRDLARVRRRQESPEPRGEQKPAAAASARGDFSIHEVSPEEAEALLSGLTSFEAPPPPPPLPLAVPSLAPVVRQVAPAKPASPVRPLPGSPDGSVSEEKLRAVFDALVKAKKRCNEDVSRVSFEQVAQSLRKQVPELMKKHNARAVEFKVVIKDGKATLRAVPREG